MNSERRNSMKIHLAFFVAFNEYRQTDNRQKERQTERQWERRKILIENPQKFESPWKGEIFHNTRVHDRSGNCETCFRSWTLNIHLALGVGNLPQKGILHYDRAKRVICLLSTSSPRLSATWGLSKRWKRWTCFLLTSFTNKTRCRLAGSRPNAMPSFKVISFLSQNKGRAVSVVLSYPSVVHSWLVTYSEGKNTEV